MPSVPARVKQDLVGVIFLLDLSLTRLLKRVTEGKRRVRTSVNRLLRKVFQSKKQKVTLG